MRLGGPTERCVSQDDNHLDRRVDRHVGARLRLRRKTLGRSQASVGKALGVSFQQVQKYERGANQLNASKLYALSEALDAPVAYFFDGLGADGDQQSDVGPQDERLQAFWSAADAGDWLRALAVLENPRLRRELLHLIQAMTAEA